MSEANPRGAKNCRKSRTRSHNSLPRKPTQELCTLIAKAEASLVLLISIVPVAVGVMSCAVRNASAASALASRLGLSEDSSRQRDSPGGMVLGAG